MPRKLKESDVDKAMDFLVRRRRSAKHKLANAKFKKGIRGYTCDMIILDEIAFHNK